MTPLLCSIFDRATNYKRLSNGTIDVIHVIENDAQMGYLQRQVLFITFNLGDLTTIFPHDITMATLTYLLREHLLDQRIADLTIDTILQLVQFFFKTQFCVYNDALYQQIHGGASSLLLTIYREQAILTWHGSKNQFLTLFNKTAVSTEHIPNATTMFIGSTVHFRDLEISYTNNGTLESKVYYDSDIDTLSNVSDELMENKSKQLCAVLYRAVRCCSDVEKFNSELLYIQVSFLTFGFTSEFIHSGIQCFYQQFGIPETFLASLLKDNKYDHLRRRIIEDVEQQVELK
ncbi:unnamed protein product [Rotaria sp. Silwood2]|nr:unnamed protein product [Rotaria sp. Silwood2]CAF4330817.1 unnamed protein product [Rotaria sp. Silwood2]